MSFDRNLKYNPQLEMHGPTHAWCIDELDVLKAVAAAVSEWKYPINLLRGLKTRTGMLVLLLMLFFIGTYRGKDFA